MMSDFLDKRIAAVNNRNEKYKKSLAEEHEKKDSSMGSRGLPERKGKENVVK